MGEHLPCKQRVGSSNLLASTNKVSVAELERRRTATPEMRGQLPPGTPNEMARKELGGKRRSDL